MKGLPRLQYRDVMIAASVLAAIGGLVVALAFLAQPYGDDYCYATVYASAAGPLDFVVSQWQTWSGRWATSAFRYAALSAWGATGAYWTTAIIGFASIVVGARIAVRGLYGAQPSTAAWATWAAVLFFLLASDPAALLFWRTAMLDYTLGYLVVPLSLASACRALGIVGRPAPLLLLPAGIGMAVSCGLAELFVYPVAAFLAIVLLRRGPSAGWLLLSTLAAAATMLTLLAPGQAARVEAAAVQPGLAEVAGGTLLYGLRGLLLPCLALYLATWIAPIGRPVNALARRLRRAWSVQTRWLVAGAVVAAPFFIQCVLFLALGAPGPGRAHNVSLFAIVLAWPVLVACAPRLGSPVESTAPSWSRRLVPIASVLLLSAVNAADLVATLASGEASAYANRVAAVRDRLDAAGDAVGTITVVLDERAPVIAPGRFLGEDAGYWVNRCVARYHGVDGVAAVRPGR